MKHETFWESAKRATSPALKKSAKFDVVVIGGGVTGLTAAYLLKQAGKTVCLLERDRVGSVDTGVTGSGGGTTCTVVLEDPMPVEGGVREAADKSAKMIRLFE